MYDTQREQKLSEQELAEIQSQFQSLRFGTLTLIVQDGKLVRLEKLEKFKLDD